MVLTLYSLNEFSVNGVPERFTITVTVEKPNEDVPHYELVLVSGRVYYIIIPEETSNWGYVNICFTTEDMLTGDQGPVCAVDGGYYHYPYNGNYGYNITIHNPDETEQRYFAIPTYIFDKFTKEN